MKVQRDGRSFTVEVSADGEGLVSHAGSALLAWTADRLGLTKALSRGLAPMRERRSRHDPGRVVSDLALTLADGGDCVADLGAVREQEPLFGTVASDSTAWRTVAQIAADPARLEALRAASLPGIARFVHVRDEHLVAMFPDAFREIQRKRFAN